MNYWQLIAMFLQAAPEEIALVHGIVDAIHQSHVNGTPQPTFVAVPPGAIALPIPPPPQAAPIAPVVLPPAQPAAPPVAATAEVPVAAAPPVPVVVEGVPGQKRDRDLKVVATPAAN